jgi:hypothetical protein
MSLTELSAISASVLNVILLVLILFRLRESATKEEVRDLSRYAGDDEIRYLSRYVRLGRAGALTEDIQAVKKGETKDEVESRLGRADNPSPKEWFYYLDEHAGYVIFFDRDDRVESVNSWKS